MSTTKPPAEPPGSSPVGEVLTAENGFPIVGIGASAGGLEACTRLLQEMPAQSGLCFLLVMHLPAHGKSHLADVLRNSTSIPTVEATEGLPVKVNHLYLIPPNTSMMLRDGQLSLIPRPPRGQHMPIDHLFRSLAEVLKSRAIGVILSGEGTDGTLGLQSIKAEGGIVFAQDEKTAQHNTMPNSAVINGSVDHVLPPEKIAEALLRIASHSYTQPTPNPEAVSADRDETIHQIINLLRAHTEVDFTNYKRTTVNRRIQRRMALRGLESYEDYLTWIRNEPAELNNLYQDFLIRVTQFFRDPEAFEALKEHVFPALVDSRLAQTPIRIWVAGCSTGEEVYSLAMVLLEYLGNRSEHFPIKFLATDLNEGALERARAGLYVDNIEIDVSPERLRRFFVRSNGHYQINKMIRDLCVFCRHNMASDPPYSHLDLVSCRNVLIYMDAALQKRMMPILHYSLNPDGFLFLGSSESIGIFGDLFVPVDPRHRIFRRKPASVGAPPDFTPYINHERGGFRDSREEGKALWSALDVQREADRIVLTRYAPVGVVIDDSMTVIQFRGRTAAFLELAPGMASLDLLRMLREGLLSEVRSAINRARGENAAVSQEAFCLTDGGQSRRVKVEVIPFKVPPSGARFFLVLFQDLPLAGRTPAPLPQHEVRLPPDGQQVVQLQQELTALREYLQSVIEEQESTNEELKSANEEIISANEELQSTNEELQTAKEEAQSANEELVTVNEELRHRNAELARVNNDLINLLSGVNIPILLVGRDLRIRRFTPQAEKLFNLIPTDLGRPISNLKPNLLLEDVSALITQVIDDLAPYENAVQDRDGRWYSLRIRPYVTLDNKIDGASVVLLDIDSIRTVLEQLKTSRPTQATGSSGGSALGPADQKKEGDDGGS